MKCKIYYTILSILMYIILYTSIVSANGLIANQSIVSINKTVGVSYSIQIQLTNSEPIDFYNVSLSNSYITMPTIPLLRSGETATVTLTTTTDSQINSNLRFKGYYLAYIGKQYRTYYLNVTSNVPVALEPCDFSITEGDTVIWKNNLLYDTITQRDINHVPVSGSQIAPGNQYTSQFNTPQTFTYYWSRFTDFATSPICTISILSSNGIINDPQMDAIVNLSISTNYPSTSISTTTISNNYTMSVATHTDGVMTVTNNGSNAAYNIYLQGDWLDFNLNNFNLNPGETRGLIYTISPVLYSTNETNRTYVKNITISGNFQTTNIPLYIFINYTMFNSNSTNTDADYLLNVFCPKYPNSFLCNQTPKIEIRYVANASNKPINITVTEQQVNDLWAYMFQLGDEIKTANNIQKQNLDDLTVKNNITASAATTLMEVQEQDRVEREKTVTNILILAVFIFIIFCAIMIGILIYVYRNRKKLEEYRTWH